MAAPTPEIKNRKAHYEYQILSSYEAGIQLTGTEVKSVRSGDVNLRDAYCLFKEGVLLVQNLYIAEYEGGNQFNHETRRPRKLLLKKSELRKIERQITEKGMTLVPLRMYFSERGYIKLEIAVVQGKKKYDKRQSIKQRDIERDMSR